MEDDPTPGAWYENDEGDLFMVERLDRNGTGRVEIRWLTGEPDEIELETWYGMELLEIEPPEEWHASMDDFLAARHRRPKP